jgi:hypothetical protein
VAGGVRRKRRVSIKSKFLKSACQMPLIISPEHPFKKRNILLISALTNHILPKKSSAFLFILFICRFLEEGKTTLFGKLLIHEFTEFTGALDVLVEDFIKPTFIKLSSIVSEIVGDKSPNKKEELCVMNIIGRCIYFRNARPFFPGCGIK